MGCGGSQLIARRARRIGSMVSTSSKMAAAEASSDQAMGKRRRKISRRWRLYTFIVPALLFLALFTIYPVFTMASLSFEQVDLGGISSGITPFVGFQNYIQVLRDGVFRHSVVTS